MAKIVQFGIKVAGLDQTVSTYGELLRLIKDSRRELQDVDPDDGIAGRKALERYAAAKEAQKQFNATVRETQMLLAASGDDANGSYRQLQNTMSILKRQFKELSREDRQGQAGEALKVRIGEISQELKQADAELGDYFRNVGNYQNAIQDAVAGIDFGAILSGDVRSLGSIQQSIPAIREQLQGVTAGTANWAAAARLVGPAFAITTILAGLTAFISLANEAEQKTANIRRQLSRFNDLEGGALSSATADVLALVEASGESEEAILRAANSISKQFKIPISDAVRSLNDLWLATGSNFSEALDQAREYPIFFKDINLSVDQFNGLIARGIQDGIFSDKGIDAIKEAVISVREMTPATRDAINALGIDDGQIEKIRSEEGLLGLVQAVIDRLQELPEQSQIAGQVLADVFRGAGEDAGAGFLRDLDLANESLKNYIDTGNDTIISDQKKLKAAQEYSAELVKLAENTKPIRTVLVDIGNAISLGFIKFLNIGSESLKEFSDLAGNIAGLFEGLSVNVSPATEAIGSFLRLIAEAINPLTRLRKAISGINDVFDQFEQRRTGVSSRADEILANSQQRILDEAAERRRAENAEKERQAVLDAEKAEAEKLAEAERQRRAEEQRRLAEERRRAEDALTGIKGIDRDIRRATQALASGALDSAQADIVRANVAALRELRAVMVTEGDRLIEDAQKYLPDIDAELSGLFAALQQPDADYETILSQIVDANAERALILQRLTDTQEGLATVEQLQGLEASLSRFRPRETATIQALPNRTATSVQSGQSTALNEITADAQAEADRRAQEFNQRRLAENEALAESYRAIGDALSESLSEAFEEGEFSAERFAATFTRSIIRSIARVIRARAAEAFALVLASDPTPAAIARAGVRLAAITSLATVAEGIANQFGEGGEIQGPPHSRGGVMINAEGGEGVLKKSAMSSSRRYRLEGTPRQIADYLNRSFGGRGMSPTTARRMELGGMIAGVNSPRIATAQAINGTGTLSEAVVQQIADAVAQGARSGSAIGTMEGARSGVLDAEIKIAQRRDYQF